MLKRGMMELKVCGLKYKENIEQVAALSPNYMGFIFYSKSKRFVGEDFVMPDIDASIKKVGVFVNAELSYIVEKVDSYKLNVVQIHGDETAAYCKGIKALLPKGVEVLKAFGIDENFDFEQLQAYADFCDYFLFDTKSKAYGGSGQTFDWDVLSKYKFDTPVFLSGGLGVEEVQKVRASNLKIHTIDVNSKFEIEPGLKDVSLLAKLFN